MEHLAKTFDALHPNHEAERERVVILINGEARDVARGDRLSYRDILLMAGEDPTRILSVTVQWSPDIGGGGASILTPNRIGVLPIRTMRISVCDTSNA